MNSVGENSALIQQAPQASYAQQAQRAAMRVCGLAGRLFTALRYHWEYYADTYENGFILASTSVYLVGEIWPSSVPEAVTNVAYSSLTVVGLLAITYPISQTKKHIGDSFAALRVRSPAGSVAALGKTVFYSTSVFFTLTDVVATGLIDGGRVRVARRIYTVTGRMGIGSLVVGGMIKIYNVWRNRRILKTAAVDIPVDHLATYRAILANPPSRIPRGIHLSPGAGDAIHIRIQMDKDTWRTFQQQLASAAGLEQVRELLEKSALPNIKTQYDVARAHVALTIFGDVLILINDNFRFSLIGAVSREVASVAYTAVMAFRKVKQHQQRKAALAIAN